MKKHSSKESIPTLDKIVKYQRQINETKQDVKRIKGKYIEVVSQHYETEKRLKIEEERTSLYCDCVEHLYFSIINAKSLNSEEKENILAKYREFKKGMYRTFLNKKSTLSNIGAYVNLKYQERRILE